jgi:hypothetical protein
MRRFIKKRRRSWPKKAANETAAHSTKPPWFRKQKPAHANPEAREEMKGE